MTLRRPAVTVVEVDSATVSAYYGIFIFFNFYLDVFADEYERSFCLFWEMKVMVEL